MIDWASFGLFLSAAVAIIVAPGPDIFYVLARGTYGGRQAGLISGLGIGFGEVIHTLLAAFGLAVLLQTSVAVFLVIKYAGALYLIYLGIKTIRQKGSLESLRQGQKTNLRSIFTQGMVTNLLNPKAILFYVAFLPQFVNTQIGDPHLQLITLGLIFAGLDVVFLCILAHFTGYISAWLTRKPHRTKWMRLGTGTVLIGLGLRLAVLERD